MTPDEPETRNRLSQQARISANSLLGYSELLVTGSASDGRAGLKSVCESVSAAALALQQPVVEYLAALPGNSETVPSLRSAVYDHVYSLVALIQSARRQAHEGTAASNDLRTVYEAVNNLIDILREMDSVELHEGVPVPLLPTPHHESRHATGRMLVVDDDPFSRELLKRFLERQGHVVCHASSGKEAFQILGEAPFDIVLLDIMMPEMNGFQFLEKAHADPRLRDLSVVVVSALDDPTSIARCIELGAEDFLPRDFDPVILQARIDSLLEKMRYKHQNDAALNRLIHAQERLAAELRDAAAYVRSLLPRKLRWRGVVADWEFIPSLSLGGDCFYYHTIDDSHLALYLLDVSGHGIQAALLSATIMNMLRSLSLGGVDFSSPSSVLSRLNTSFRLEDQNNMYFTIWYGVFDVSTGLLRYAGAGSPPAVLIDLAGNTSELSGDGPVIGIDENARFSEFDEIIEPGSSLYLFSDGIYEVHTVDGDMLSWERFRRMLVDRHATCRESPSCISSIRSIVDDVRQVMKRQMFDDDVSIVEFRFSENA